MSAFEAEIAAYLSHRMPDVSDLTVDDLAQIHGGGSQEMFRFRARWAAAGEQVEQFLILRREPSAGLVEAERDLEFKVYQGLAGSSIPVPKACFLELDGKWLQRPFFIMEMAPGKAGHPYLPGDPYDGHGVEVARQFWRHLGALARVDYHAAGLQCLRNGDAHKGFAARELAHWTALLDKNETHPEPIVRGALRKLMRDLPPEPHAPSIVHGDYRSGNFLFTPDGMISAILDWEMCHIGDPIEDVAWALDVMWPMTRHLPLEEGLSIWQAASGTELDRCSLKWWRLFSAFKASVLWTTASRSFEDDPSRSVVLIMSAINAGHIHRKEILRMMREEHG